MSDKDTEQLDKKESESELGAVADNNASEGQEADGILEDNDSEVSLGNMNLKAIYDIPVDISAVLGATSMSISELVKLGKGTVIKLDRKVGESIDIYVNNRIVAKGEVVIIENRIGITLTEIIKSHEAK